MGTLRLTMAQALVRYLAAQHAEIDGARQRLFAGVWAIFGHGNVAALGEALAAHATSCQPSGPITNRRWRRRRSASPRRCAAAA